MPSRALQRIFAASLVLSLLSSPAMVWSQDAATADTTDQLRALIGEATRLAFEGNYDEAISRYFEAKTLSDDARLDFNIARCYHKKGDCDSAVQFYKALLERDDAAPEDRKDAQRYLEELGQCGAAPIENKPPEQTEPPQETKVPEEKASGTSTQGLVGWGVTITGGVLVLAGVGLDVGSAGLQDDLEAAASAGDTAAYNQARDDIDSRQTLIYGLYGLGAAATVTGLVILLLDDGAEASPEASAWRVSPWLGPGTTGAALDLRF